ncbi:MAG TPA: hypothetical protein VNZ64_09140 [Candidatus Acidoferrum sp.]|nr:hypothetical protein [Candidatus Acidoferrum sp.]
MMMEIMGKTKKDNPVCRGWIEKVRTNYYKITSLGLAEAERVNSVAVGAAPTVRSPEPIYDAVSGFLEHPVFQSHLKSAEEPRTWLGAAAFLGLSQYTPDTLERRMRTVREAVVKALDWLAQTGQGTLTRGPVGGGVQIQRRDLEKVRAFLDVLEERFAIQFKAIRSRQG